MKINITQLKNLENISISSQFKHSFWQILISLSSLLYLPLLNLNISSKFNLLAFYVACFLILIFEVVTYATGSYLQILLKKKEDNNKPYSNLHLLVIILFGILILASIAFLNSASNEISFFLILALLPINLNLYTRKNLTEKKSLYLKILKIVILLLYPILFFSLSFNKAILVAGCAFLTLFSSKFILSEIKIYKLKESHRIKLYKLIIFLLINTPLLLSFLANVGALGRIYTFASLPILYIFKILKIDNLDTKENQEKLYYEVKLYICLQILTVLTLLLLF